MDLSGANFNLMIDAKILDKKLDGLKWISCLNQNDPNKEILNLKESINIIKKDGRKKGIITEYQFISVILSTYDYSPTQVWFMNHVVNLDKDSKFFKSYQDLLINKIRENKIEIFYLVKPFWHDDKLFEKGLDKECFKKTNLTKTLDSYLIQKCDKLSD